MSPNSPIAWTLPQYEATTIETDGVSALLVYKALLELTYVDNGKPI